MTAFRRFCALLCCLAAMPLALAQVPAWTVAITATAPPFAFRDDAGVLKGFNVDLVQALCERMQRACRLEVMRFPDVIPAVSSGRADIGVANTLKTAEREKLVRFTRVVWRSTSSLIGRRELGGASPVQLLANLQTCGIAGTRQLSWLAEKASRQPLSAPGNNEVLDMLTKNQCELTMLPTQQALPFLQSAAGQRFAYIGIPMAEDGLGGEVHMVLRPGTDALQTEVDRALDSLVRDGTHERLSRRYFPFSIL